MSERCVAARCSNVADPKNNISMHKIQFFGEQCPITKKEVYQFRVGEVKDVCPGKMFYFKIQVQQYRYLNLGANCY